MTDEALTDLWRALARSAPVLWREVEFDVVWTGFRAFAPVRARVGWGTAHTAGAVRVTDLATGDVLIDEGGADISGSWTVVTFDDEEPRARGLRQRTAEMAAAKAEWIARLRDEVVVRPDGLLAVRPPDSQVFGEPGFYRDYRWVAMLDPLELADGWDDEAGPRATDGTPLAGVWLDEIRRVDHHGRTALEAVVRPGDYYQPRCSCCPLLLSQRTQDQDGWPGHPTGGTFADAHLVRLDEATGICVYTAEIGGSDPGAGHDLVIRSVAPGEGLPW